MRISYSGCFVGLLATAAYAAPETFVLYDFTEGTHGWTAALLFAYCWLHDPARPYTPH